MESSLKKQSSLVSPLMDEDSPIGRKNPRTQFSDQILKRIIGNDRANQALHSLSLGVIPVITN